MSRRETKPGPVIKTLDELVLALLQPSVYWKGKATPSSFVHGLQFNYVVRQIPWGYFRWSIKEASQHGKGARPSRGVFGGQLLPLAIKK